MIQTRFAEKVDLANCESEPIHIPGSIQPHGILFVLQEPELTILQVSANSVDFFGVQPQALLGQNLETLIEPSQVNLLRKALQGEDLQEINPLELQVNTVEKQKLFDGIVHRVDGVLILELESSIDNRHISSLSLYNTLMAAANRLQKATNLPLLCKIAAEEFRKITRLDRVMVYQFDKDWNGTVIAEEREPSLPSFLTLRFPASDIPVQARALYLQNSLRLIANVEYHPVAIVPVNNPVTGGSLDLSLSTLRSVSPVHLEYLKNMGVSASLSVSLIVENKLWGLIVCHHMSTRYLPHEVRKACELLGQIVSSFLSSKEDYDDYVHEWKVKTIQASLVGNIPKEENVLDGLMKYGSNVLELVSAKGMAVSIIDRYVTVGGVRRYVTLGDVPSEQDVQGLIEWLQSNTTENLFVTDSLATLYKEAEKFKDVASGVLAMAIARDEGSYVLWFRPEVIQTVNWGGDPHKPVLVGEQDMRVHPRKSFELWKQSIRLTSLPWRPIEVQAVYKLRSVIANMVLRDRILRQKLRAWLAHTEN